MEFSKARAVGACVLLMALLRPAVAQDELTLAAALDQALKRNPDLIASGFALNAAQARGVQAGLRPNPELTLEFENFAGSKASADALETTLAMSQVIELGGKRRLRVAVAEADRELVAAEQRAHQLDLLAEVTRRFVEVAAAQQRLNFVREAQGVATQSHEAISQRVAAARSPVAELSRARISLLRANIELAQAQSNLRTARYQLAATFGDVEPQFATVRAELFAFRDSQPFNAWIAQLAGGAEALRFASAERLRDAELRLAQAQSRPNLSVSLGVRHFSDLDGTALVAGVSMPIAWSDRNQGAIAEGRAQLARTQAERTAALGRARATLVALHQEMEAAQARATALRNLALPEAREALAQTRTGYERGRFSFLDLTSAQSEVLEIGLAAIDAAADHHRLRAELERLTGGAP